MDKQYIADTDNAVWREIDGDVVLMRLRDGTVYTLDETGAFIWNILKEEAYTQERIVQLLCEEYEIDEQTACSDIAELLADLLKENLIVVSNDGITRGAPIASSE